MTRKDNTVVFEIELPQQAAQVLQIAARKAGASPELYGAICTCAGLFEHLVANGEHEVANLVSRHTKALAAQCGEATVRMATVRTTRDGNDNLIGISRVES